MQSIVIPPLNRLVYYGNNVMNLPPTLYKRIVSSSYYKSLVEKSFVTHLNPFIQQETPSSCLTLLVKCFDLKLDNNQLLTLLNADSSLLKGIGILFCRFCSHPNNLYTLYTPHLKNALPVALSVAPNITTTIGELCRMLLVDNKFMGVLMVRIPAPIQKTINGLLQKEFGSIDTKLISHVPLRKTARDYELEFDRERRSTDSRVDKRNDRRSDDRRDDRRDDSRRDDSRRDDRRDSRDSRRERSRSPRPVVYQKEGDSWKRTKEESRESFKEKEPEKPKAQPMSQAAKEYPRIILGDWLSFDRDMDKGIGEEYNE